jgi:hypothetical protein
MQTMNNKMSILPDIFSGSVGLSNPPANQKQLPVSSSPEFKRKFSVDDELKRTNRQQQTMIETIVSPLSNHNETMKGQMFSSTAEIVRTYHEHMFASNSLVFSVIYTVACACIRTRSCLCACVCVCVCVCVLFARFIHSMKNIVYERR